MMETNPWAPGKPSVSTHKDAERQRIARQTAEFIKRGGKINQIAPGVTGFVPIRQTRVKQGESA